MYCQNCGKEISKESQFCKFCGGSLNAKGGPVKDTTQTPQEIKPETNKEINKTTKGGGWSNFFAFRIVSWKQTVLYFVLFLLFLFGIGTISQLVSSNTSDAVRGVTTTWYLVIGLMAAFKNRSLNKSKGIADFFIWGVIAALTHGAFAGLFGSELYGLAGETWIVGLYVFVLYNPTLQVTTKQIDSSNEPIKTPST